MLWGVPSRADPDWVTAASAAQHVLGYNEPDLSSQSNIIPSVAAAGWQMYFGTLPANIQLGAPAVTNSGYGVLPYQGLGRLDSSLQTAQIAKSTLSPSIGTTMQVLLLSKTISSNATVGHKEN
jgi:hypothetical protein